MSGYFECLSCIHRFSCSRNPSDLCGYEKEEIGTLILRAVELERVYTEGDK